LNHPNTNNQTQTGASAAGDFNFFPSTVFAKSASPDVPPLKPFPAAWSLAAQTAYPTLGNADATGLLKIAVSDYFPDGPTLYVMPGAWCDTAGAGVVGPNPNGLTAKGAIKPESAPVEAPAPNAAAPNAAAPNAAAPNAAAPNAAAPNAAAPNAAAPNAAARNVAANVAAPNAPAPNAAPKNGANAGAHRRLMQEAAPAPEVTDAGTTEAEPEPAVAPNAAAPNAAAPNAAAPNAAAKEVVVPESAPAPAPEPIFTVNADGTCALVGDVMFHLGDGAPAQIAEKINVDDTTVYKVALPANMADVSA